MNKNIPFSIKRKQDIIDGKFSVETRLGDKVKIIYWDKKNYSKRVVGLVGDDEWVYTWDKHGICSPSDPRYDLILVSNMRDVPQDEFWRTMDEFAEDYMNCSGNCVKVIDEYYLKLMTIAKKMLEEKPSEEE